MSFSQKMLVKFKLLYVFLVSLAAFLFFPGTHLLFFAPFLIVTFYKCSLIQSLWLAAGTGLLVDFFSSSFFGNSACIYTIASYILYRQNRHFFEDKVSTLSLMTTLFSLLASVLQFIFNMLFDLRPLLSFSFLLTDFIIMPLIDGAYAYLFFLLPYQLYRKYTMRKQVEEEEI